MCKFALVSVKRCADMCIQSVYSQLMAATQAMGTTAAISHNPGRSHPSSIWASGRRRGCF
jgi:hypothetical protein